MSERTCCSCVQRMSVVLPKRYDFALVGVLKDPIYNEVTNRCAEIECTSCGQKFYAGTWDALVLSEECERQFQQKVEELIAMMVERDQARDDMVGARDEWTRIGLVHPALVGWVNRVLADTSHYEQYRVTA